MNVLPLQLIFIAAVLYGLISFAMELKKQERKWYNIGIYVALVVVGIISFIMTMDA